ncbi:MAG: M23 family metallopeptidase, partial [Chitinispirillaceae bacterium]|nr:M23 family metallopeptidase [Chitinispirillaceae bacterium]
MKKKKKPKNFYTLILVPEDNGKITTLHISRFVLNSFIVFLIVFIVGLLLLLYKSGEIAAKLQLLSLIKLENEKLIKENNNLRDINEKLNKLDILSKYLYNLSLYQNDELKNIEESKKIGDDTFTRKNDIASSTKESREYSLVTNEQLLSYPNILPVEGWVTRKFSLDSSVMGHAGIDFAAAIGTPIKATAPGIVENIKNDKYFGLIVTLLHENGFVTRYGHCSQILVSKHERVNKGQTIALVGNTGLSTGPH